MAINSRAKGNRAMNYVAKAFQSWWGGVWQRRGGGFTGDDLIPPDGFPYSIEVKDVSTVKAVHFLQPTKELSNYWAQAKDQAHRIGKIALLVIKAERSWFVARAFKDTPISKSQSGLWANWGEDPVLILPIDEFFKHYDSSSDSER